MAHFPRDGTDTSPTEVQWTELNRAVEPDSFVVSGFTLSDGGGTTLSIAAGTAYVYGYYVNESGTTTVTVNAAATRPVWLAPDGSTEWIVTPTDSNSIRLGRVTGDGAGITAITYDQKHDTGTVYKRKSGNETTTGTTRQDDDDLFFTAGAGEVWDIRAHLIADISGGASTSEIDLEVEVPSGVIAGARFGTQETSGGSSVGDGCFEMSESYTAATGIVKSLRLQTTSSNQAIEINAIAIIGEDGGTVKIKWGRTVSGTLTVREGSALVARRIR